MSIVIHHFWGSPGGGQLVCAAVAYALEKIGLLPTCCGTFRFDKRFYLDWYGIDMNNYPTVTLPFDIKAFGLLSRLIVWYPAIKVIKQKKPEIIFTDEVTYKPLLRYSNLFSSLIEYIHFPLEIYINKRFFDYADPYITERYSHFPMSIYWNVFKKLLTFVSRNNPFDVANLVLTNSNWTANVIKTVYGELPKVLNPPIAPNVGRVEELKAFEERELTIVMLGRFSQEKRYHWVIKELMPRLVKEVRGVKLKIFGGANTPTLKLYFNEIKKISANFNVELYPNAHRSLINNSMDSARVFLHATINEHWGISVAEAMCRGLPIVIHTSGGAWTDLAEYGERGLGYKTLEEAVNNLARLLTDQRSWKYYSLKALEKAGELTLDKFVNKFNRFVNEI